MPYKSKFGKKILVLTDEDFESLQVIRNLEKRRDEIAKRHKELNRKEPETRKNFEEFVKVREEIDRLYKEKAELERRVRNS